MLSRLPVFHPRAATFCFELKKLRNDQKCRPLESFDEIWLEIEIPKSIGSETNLKIASPAELRKLRSINRSCERYNGIQNFLINLPPINCFRAADFEIGVGLPRDWPVMSCARFAIVLRPTQLHWHQLPDSVFRRWRYTTLDRRVLPMEWPDRRVRSFQKKRLALWGSVSSFTLLEPFSSEYDHQLCISHLLFEDSRVHTKYLSYSAFPIYCFLFSSPQSIIKQLRQQYDAIALFLWQWFVDVN
jgi:hypothetical protein